MSKPHKPRCGIKLKSFVEDLAIYECRHQAPNAGTILDFEVHLKRVGPRWEACLVLDNCEAEDIAAAMQRLADWATRAGETLAPGNWSDESTFMPVRGGLNL